MDHSFKDLSVIREGDASGNRMVIKVKPTGAIHPRGLRPRVNFSYTGPTWAWLFENEGLTLIDAGEFGSFQELDEGLHCAGFRAKDIQRVIITHGHEDHDGSVAELVDATGAQVWAHDIYSHLQGYDPREITRRRPRQSRKSLPGLRRRGRLSATVTPTGPIFGTAANPQD